ncbi:hypothetical protein XENTR_v10013158 [Xenopus tropicalis]|uniref:Kanadaptin n=1 Tax=Xenopus tropicalis TaxID=8364 RepID=A0A6I8RX42_XENTR|nr:kanadaptin [Xenopus tropicalis]KAE8600262.1 hypothetical protein XENTR_v10013158 [Xenopus tropicalis]
MEALAHDPDGRERASYPGAAALEAGDTGAPGAGDNGQGGSAAGEPPSTGGPTDTANGAPTPGPGVAERGGGEGAGGSEGPKNVCSRGVRDSHEGLGGHRHESSSCTGTSAETQRDSRPTQGPNDSQSQGPNDSQSQGPNDSQSQGPNDSQSQGPNDSQSQGPNHAQSEGSHVTQCKGPNDSQCQGPNHAQCQGPNHAQCQGPNHAQSEGSHVTQCQGPNNTQSRGANNAQSQGSHVTPKGPDNSQSQGPHVTQSHGEGQSSSWTNEDEHSNASGASTPKESSSPRGISSTGPDSAGATPEKQPSPRPSYGEIASRTPSKDGGSGCSAPRDSPMEGPDDARTTESFKKPIFAARPSGTEKAAQPRDKPVVHSQPSAPTCSRTPSAETPTDGNARLPSDAYRTCPAIPYREPPWSGLPEALYCLEILKGGSIVSTKNLGNVSWTVFGRLPSCHVSLEHPSVSRYHAVLQYRHVQGSGPDEEPGFYVYDLGSTHGTFLNKQRIQAKTYCRIRVGHVLKFGGSTRLFILQGPEEDQEEESDLTVTQIKEARRQRESLQKRMLGDDSDEEESSEDGKNVKEPGSLGDDGGCMWGMGEDALQEDNEENPIAAEFQEEKETLYLKNPKKALQGFFDREGEELEYEYEEQGPSTWLCRVKLPADDASGKQLVAEAVHSGKKKEASVVCALEACRMLEMRGLLRQEAVARKRKAKNWEDEDFYDSDDDTFLDRTGLVEKKRLNRMKKAGKIEDKPETYDSLVVKLNAVEKELCDIAAKLQTSHAAESQGSAQDSLDAFMTEIKSGAALDGVARKKLHLHSFELKKEQQRLKGLIKIVQPTKLPELSLAASDSKTKKPALPMFGAMKGGSKFKLKTGTVGKPAPKRTDLPESFFNMKGDENEVEEEDEEEEMQVESKEETAKGDSREKTDQGSPIKPSCSPPSSAVAKPVPDMEEELPHSAPKNPEGSEPDDESPAPCKSKAQVSQKEASKHKEGAVKQKKMHGPSRPPVGAQPTRYPEDDPDYSVWMPPTGQTGDGKTHLNEKYGY